ncbi:MAG: hypothetical protein FWH14_08530 [Oscillospiraceae bacterium]|nr:hypothetical protein [Oscillospiraceae bacterium]
MTERAGRDDRLGHPCSSWRVFFSVPTANPVCHLASPFGRGVTPWRDGEGMTAGCFSK